MSFAFVITPVAILFGLLGLAAFVVEVVAFGFAVKAPAGAYIAAGKMSKGAWVAITAFAMAIGFVGVPLPYGGTYYRFGGPLSIAALVAALVFMISVRPALKPYGGPSGRGGPGRPGGW
ncbi:MAG: DUF2516 family protein [Bifidobacteriaceae bacterium]|jgi:hypothetical protein|nr:DUF2516 family protein [Bifidobacteriaceae bacterium]